MVVIKMCTKSPTQKITHALVHEISGATPSCIPLQADMGRVLVPA